MYNLKNISNIYGSQTFELIACKERKDIIFNYFDMQLGINKLIDSSLRTYLKFNYLKHNQRNNIFILKEKVNLNNPLYSINSIASNFHKMFKIGKIKLDSKLSKQEENNLIKIGKEKHDVVISEDPNFKGIIFNEKFYKETFIKSSTYYESVFQEKEIFNGILIYKNNKLIKRYKQSILGDSYFFIEFCQKQIQNKKYEENLLGKTGYIEITSDNFELLTNKLVSI